MRTAHLAGVALSIATSTTGLLAQKDLREQFELADGLSVTLWADDGDGTFEARNPSVYTTILDAGQAAKFDARPHRFTPRVRALGATACQAPVYCRYACRAWPDSSPGSCALLVHRRG